MKLTVVKETTFDAAHFLPDYNGKCKNVHGHQFKLQIGVKGKPEQVDRRGKALAGRNEGMVVDFSILKSIMEEVVTKRLDHTFLNTVEAIGFPRNMPTAENIVMWVVKEFKEVFWLKDQAMPLYGMELEFVRLYETPTSYAEWRNED